MGTYSDSGRENPNRLKSGYYLNFIFLCLIILILLAVCILLFLKARRLEIAAEKQQEGSETTYDIADAVYTQTDMDRAVMQARASERRTILLQIQASLESGNSTMNMLRELFPETVVVMHEGRYYFYPLQGTLTRNIFPRGSFGPGENDAMTYLGDRDDIAVTSGIVVSESTGSIEWDKAAEAQIAFSIIHAGSLSRDGEEDEDAVFAEDSEAAANLSGAVQNGIRPGLYVELNAMTEKEAVREAQEAVKLLVPFEGQSYVIAAFINVPDESDPLSSLSRAEWTAYARAFCDTVRKAGYTPVLYANMASLHMLLDLSVFEDCDKWITGLSDPAYYPYAFRFWEYNDSGIVTGIENAVRLVLQVQKKVQGQ